MEEMSCLTCARHVYCYIHRDAVDFMRTFNPFTRNAKFLYTFYELIAANCEAFEDANKKEERDG